MNLPLAKLELDACTLRPQDASDQSRSFAAQDPDLVAWLKQRTLFDAKIAEIFEQPVIPAGLRHRILQISQQPKQQPLRWLIPTLLSVAAAFVIGWATLWPGNRDMPSWQSDSLVAVAKLQYGLSRLDERAPTLEAVKKLLIATDSTTPHQILPASLADLPTYGCKRIQIANRPATIICFKMVSGQEAHLVIMDTPYLEKKAIAFNTSKHWNMATWGEGGQTFMLASTAEISELRRLLS